MTHEIKNNRLVDVEYQQTNNGGGAIDPKFIVMHYTAGFSHSGAVDILTRKGTSVSAHLVVGRGGEITQLQSFNRRCWHAGPSFYQGYKGINGHSVGIEIDNPGFFKQYETNSDGLVTRVVYAGRWINMPYELHKDDLESIYSERVGSTVHWIRYTEQQLAAVESVTRALIDKYDIKDIVSHEEIDTRGWKTDPGPLFPMERFKAIIGARHNDVDKYEVDVKKNDALNVRNGPTTKETVLFSLEDGDQVSLLERDGRWWLVEVESSSNSREGTRGWVYSAYLRRV